MPDTTPTTDRNGLAALLAHHADVLAAHWDAVIPDPAAYSLRVHAGELTADEETPFVRELLDSILAFETEPPARLVLGTTDQQPETAPADRRARYAAAIRETDGWVLDGGQHMLDAVMAVADAEQAELRAEADALSAELTRRAPLLAYHVTEIIRLRAEVEGLDEALQGAITVSEKDGARLRADRAAVLREASNVAHGEASRLYDDMGQKAAAGARMVGARLERMADEAQQPETEAHPAQTEWIGEVLEDDAWMYLGASPDRSVAEKRRASITRRHPDAQTRTVRKTTTYTVAADQPDTETEAQR
ncbi:hypothetical protein ACPXCP_31160 [Streptomyces sp. DT20]|uniref:hypothetical protein n=1 Tax=Streptomyces sp. DT20 TaxID=3416519 RepID=UPI003CF08BC7